MALLIYSDPQDDGFVAATCTPKVPMRNSAGVQRGSVFNGDGDPSTPGYAEPSGRSAAHARRRRTLAHSRRADLLRQRDELLARRARRGDAAGVAGRSSVPISRRPGTGQGASRGSD